MTAVIDLKARLDEDRNILWGGASWKAGVHVVFGFVGLKTHCKVALVVRREDDGIRRYVHLAPAITTRRRPASIPIWDSSPAMPIICEDVSRALQLPYRLLRAAAVAEIDRAPPASVVHAREDRAGNGSQRAGKRRIIAKINGLLEPPMVQALTVPARPVCHRYHLPGHLALPSRVARHQRDHPGPLDRGSFRA